MRVKFEIGNPQIGALLSYWTDLEIIPRRNEWVTVTDFLSDEEIDKLQKTAFCWSGDDAEVMFVTLRQDEKGWYYYAWLDCEN